MWNKVVTQVTQVMKSGISFTEFILQVPGWKVVLFIHEKKRPDDVSRVKFPFVLVIRQNNDKWDAPTHSPTYPSIS